MLVVVSCHLKNYVPYQNKGRTMRFLFCICAIGLLTACQTYFNGTKPGSGQQEFSNDFLECEAVSRRVAGRIDDNTVVTCMQGKGWQMTTKQVLAPLF